MIIKDANVFDPVRGFIRKDVCWEGDAIVPAAGGETVSLPGRYVIPGLTDLHFHGCRGADFSDGDGDGLRLMADYELSRGVTQICPAGMTLETEQLFAICRAAARHKKTAVSGAELVGINLEGPFLAEAKKGAQNAAWLKKPDPELFFALCEAAEGLVKLVTVAPEVEGARDFIRRVSGSVTVSLGHTAADYDTAMAAFEAGAREVTHLFNAMEPFAHRKPGLVGAAFDSDCRVELICDGVHIHPSVVRAVFRLFGPERVVLISDTMRAAGLPDGDYTLGGQGVTVKGPRSTLPDGTIAGSATDLMRCMVTAVSFGIPLKDAVTAAAVNPARVLGIYDRVGSIDPGKTANLAVLEPDLSLRAVIFRGKTAFGRL